MMKKIIRFLVFLCLVFVYFVILGLIILVVNLNMGILIGILTAVYLMVFLGYKLRSLPLKTYKVILKWIKMIYFKYEKATPNLLLIQRKLLVVVIISGLLFVLFDSIALVRFNKIFNTTVSEAVIYRRTNFMFPNVLFDEYSRKGKEYSIYERAIQRGEFPIYVRWNWYSDEVFLSGITFLTSLFFLFISIIIKKVIEETKKL